MTVLLQISDPHFGTERDEVVEALLALAWQLQPEVVVLSGDITQRARARQFDAARRFVDRLPAALRLIVPGNHDIPLFNIAERLFCAYRGHRRVFGDDLEPVVETDTLLVLGVNTTRAWRHTDGEVSAAQVERVAQRLRRATAQQLRIVVTHQPVDVPRPRDEHNLLHGREAAVRRWAAAGADILMGGHIHLPYVRALTGRYPDLARAAWCVQAGTSVSTRIRPGAPNSVNVIRYLPASQRCSVERWDCLAGGAFSLGEITTMTLDRSAGPQP